MKSIKLLFIFILVPILSCGSKDKTELNENEKLALDSIAKYYDGNLTLHKGFEFIDEKKMSFIELTIKDSKAISDYVDRKYLPPSNIALILFSHLSGEDTKKYEKYRVSVGYNGELKNYEYTSTRLRNVHTCLDGVDILIEYLREENYQEFKTNIDSSFINFDKNQLIEKLRLTTSEYGDINDHLITGFTFNKTEDGQMFSKIYGILKRSNKDNFFTFFLKPDNCNIIMVEYKW